MSDQVEVTALTRWQYRRRAFHRAAWGLLLKRVDGYEMMLVSIIVGLLR